MLMSILPVLFIATLLTACGKEEEYNIIPYAKVDFQFFPATEKDKELSAYLGVKKFPGVGCNGNGVFVCQVSPSGGTFLAYDATCPLEADYKASVALVNSGILKVKCPRCGTVYDLQAEGRGGNTRLQRYSVKAFAFNSGFQVTN